MRQKVKHLLGLVFALVLLCTNIPWQTLTAAASTDDQVQSAETEYKSSLQLVAEEAYTIVKRTPEELQEIMSVWKPLASRYFHDMDQETAEWVDEAGEELAKIVAERDVMALVYLHDTYPIRKVPDDEGEIMVTVRSGQMVNIVDIYVDENYQIWEQVELNYKGVTVGGYIPREFLAASDMRFLEWEDMYGMGSRRNTYALDENGVVAYEDIETFPADYKRALAALKEAHPDWTFVKFSTGLDWNTSVTEELKDGKSLIYKTMYDPESGSYIPTPDWAKEGLYDDGKWYYASREALELYMDPRNSLTEDYIFQFEQLTYNEQYHTRDAVKKFLDGTFMDDDKNAPETAMTYEYIIYMLGKEPGREVSPFHLAARILQEQGDGTSGLISGTYPGYEGYYNYFNIGATGKTTAEVIENGLKYAVAKDWHNAYFSIMGGADFISKDYIKKGQDSLYLQKYNVNPDAAHAVYTHQYMQNISAPTTEAKSIKKLYANAGSLDNTFVFSIPVFENMPGTPCEEPEASTNVVLDIPAGYTDTSIWLDGVEYQGEMRNDKLIVTAPDGNAKTAVMYKYNASGVPTGMYVWSLNYNGVVYTATAEPQLEDLLTYHGFSIRITGKTGIRIKTGIDTELRTGLTTTGVNGYKMTKYGTLVMKNENRGTYPMVVGGQKILDGVIYGYDANGKWNNKYFEIKDGRLRYGSVLTGLPVNQYKVDYAFRGYAVLEKNGQEMVVYGPVTHRSIYALAKQLLDSGSYQPGTDAHTFLSKLISDADGLENPSVSGGDAAGGQPSVSGGDAAAGQPSVSGGDAAAGQPSVSGNNAAN